MSEDLKLYSRLYPIRHLLGAFGAALLVTAIRWWNEMPLKTALLTLIAGIVLIITMFALKHEYLKRRKILGDL